MNNGNCGHAFCLICILKRAFSLIQYDCGDWHEALECPLCRATLPDTPIDNRLDKSTFPFVPNRLGDAVIKSYLAVLQDAADSQARLTASCSGGSQHGFLWHGEID